jgi:hypothetical protein
VVVRTAIAGVLFLVAVSGVITANMVLYMMIGEVNRKRSDQDQISYFGFWIGKLALIVHEYRRLYPRGRLNGWMWGLFFSSVLAMVGACALVVSVSWAGS